MRNELNECLCSILARCVKLEELQHENDLLKDENRAFATQVSSISNASTNINISRFKTFAQISSKLSLKLLKTLNNLVRITSFCKCVNWEF